MLDSPLPTWWEKPSHTYSSARILFLRPHVAVGRIPRCLIGVRPSRTITYPTQMQPPLVVAEQVEPEHLAPPFEVQWQAAIATVAVATPVIDSRSTAISIFLITVLILFTSVIGI